MPWATTTRPSLSLGLLAARARARGLNCDVLYPNVLFSALVGASGYEFLSNTPAYFGVAEHVFATDLFGREALRSSAYLDSFAEDALAEASAGLAAPERDAREILIELRDRIVPASLDACIADVAERRPAVVGFTCTFNQVLPSVALARRIKQLDPHIVVVLGGPCVHGPMGVCYSRIFRDYVDAVFLGEADDLFPDYMQRLARGESPDGLGGLAIGGVRQQPAPLFRALDDLETPDYTDYFELRDHLTREGFQLAAVHSLPFEGSRGCWWGEKHHCTFCGLNNEGMAFRRKSSGQVIAELGEMAERHQITRFMAADNILDHRAFDDLLPALEAAPLAFDLFFELKTNLRRTQVERLRKAGVTWVQPGIESFSDHVLQLMRKGVGALQNVQTLKWLSEFGIRTSYNLLVGFPGETDRDYEDLLAMIRCLRHLPPPGPAASLVQVQRFAPFHFANEELGIGPIRGARFYDHLIPSSVAAKEEYAYFFDHDLPADAPVFRHLNAVNAALDAWCGSTYICMLQLAPGSLQLLREDDRNRVTVTLDSLSSALLLLADEVISETTLVRRVAAAGLGSTSDVISRLDELARDGLLLRNRGKLVCPIPLNPCASQSALLDWIESTLPRLGRRAAYEAPPLSDSIGIIDIGGGTANGPSQARSGA
jgi:ribosomal peptide maturation radical SAM protein 1